QGLTQQLAGRVQELDARYAQALPELQREVEVSSGKVEGHLEAAMQQLLAGRIRLPGFSGEWEPKRLGDIASFFKGSGLSKADLSPEGRMRCIHYGELFTTYGERIAEVLNG